MTNWLRSTFPDFREHHLQRSRNATNCDIGTSTGREAVAYDDTQDPDDTHDLAT